MLLWTLCRRGFCWVLFHETGEGYPCFKQECWVRCQIIYLTLCGRERSLALCGRERSLDSLTHLSIVKPSKIHRKLRAWEYTAYCGIVERCAIHWWFWRYPCYFGGNQEIFVSNLYESVRNRSQRVPGCVRDMRGALAQLSFWFCPSMFLGEVRIQYS